MQAYGTPGGCLLSLDCTVICGPGLYSLSHTGSVWLGIYAFETPKPVLDVVDRSLTHMQATNRKLASLLGLTALFGAVVTAIRTPSANQYELSLYSAYPTYFWVLVVSSLLIGSIVIISSARSARDQTWVYGFSLVFLTNIFVLLLPFFRGYQMYGRSDGMSHIGFMREITSTGEIGSNIYPPMHLLSITLADATGADPMAIGMFVPVLFSVIYFGGMYYLLVYLFDTRTQILFGLPFVLLPVLRTSHVAFATYDISIMLIPLVLYLFFKSQQKPLPRVRAAFVLTLVAIVFYHPLTALFLIGVFFLYFVGEYAPPVTEQYGAATNFVSLAAVIFVAWYSTYAGIIIRFQRVYESLVGVGGESSPVDSYAETSNEASIQLLDMVLVITFRYGLEFLIFGLAFSFLLVVLWAYLQGVPSIDTRTVIFGGTFCIFAFGGLFFLVFDLLVPHDRPWQIAKIAAVVLVGQLVGTVWYSIETGRWGEYRRVFDLSLVILLAVLFSLSTAAIYQSPAESESNHQMTEMEIEGSNWLMEKGEATDQLMEFHLSHTRFHHAERGITETPHYQATEPPPHFNYTNHAYLGASVDQANYLTLNRHGRITYPETFENYPENWRFTPDDFDRLERDASTNRIYDNGDYNQYLVSSV